MTTSSERRFVEQVMGLPITLALRGRHTRDELAEAAWAAVLASLRDADRTFSTWREDSWIRRLDRAEVRLEDCPPEVAEVLELGERARRESHGAFDVRRPGPAGRRVLDPSGVVKGWAVQRADALLADLRADDTDTCLSAGGDLLAHVVDPDRPAWRVGVEDPHHPERVLAVVPVRRGGVATSGLTHRGAHVVDPRSGATPTDLASVTVIAPGLVEADVDATAALVLGRDAPAWLRARGRDGLAVWADGRVEVLAAVGASSTTPTVGA